MSLLSIGQSVLNITGWDDLSSIAGNTDRTARQVLALANDELKSLSNRFDWRHLVKEYSFATVIGTASYSLPADYGKLMQDSVYNEDEYYRLRSGMSDNQWNAWRFGLLGSLSHQRYRVIISGATPQFVLSPTPASVETLVMLYKSTYFAVASDTTAKSVYELDSDVSKIPEDVVEKGLLWRFKRAKGLDFSAELSEYNEMTRTRYAQTRGESDIPIPNGLVTPEITDGYVPDSGFGA